MAPDLTRCWEVDAGHIVYADFLASLPSHFPESTTLFVEGSTISPDVRAALELHVEHGAFLPGANTIWPRSEKFRCKYSVALINTLILLSSAHAEPELFDHFSLYRHAAFLLYWPDALNNAMWLSPELSESRVAAFAGHFGRGYHFIGPGKAGPTR